MKIFSLIILFTLSAAAQQAPTLKIETENMRHQGNVDKFDHLRVSSPAVISFFDGKFIEAIERDPFQVKNLQLYVEADSQLPKDFQRDSKDRSKLWWIVYCLDHRTVFFIEEYKKQK